MTDVKSKRTLVVDTPTLLFLRKKGEKRGYNRVLDPSVEDLLDRNGVHLITLALHHEHIAGERVEPHMRLVIMARTRPGVGTHHPEYPDLWSTTLQMDVSMEDFEALEEVVHSEEPLAPTVIIDQEQE